MAIGNQIYRTLGVCYELYTSPSMVGLNGQVKSIDYQVFNRWSYEVNPMYKGVIELASPFFLVVGFLVAQKIIRSVNHMTQHI